MSFNVNVKGGTRAGWRKIKRPEFWVCKCDQRRDTYSCPDCGARRP